MIGLQDQFCEYMFQQAVKNDWKSITENKSKFLLVSIHAHAPLLGSFFKEGGLPLTSKQVNPNWKANYSPVYMQTFTGRVILQPEIT